MISEPIVKEQQERRYFGLRFAAPYRGMFSEVSAQFRNLDLWMREHRSIEYGPRFLRYHVIDMRGTMELEVGILGSWDAPFAGQVSTGIMPAGRYATLTYRGLGLAANKTLLAWIADQGLRADKRATARGEAFAGRYEAYLTDPKVEPRKKQWDIELAIKLEG